MKKNRKITIIILFCIIFLISSVVSQVLAAESDLTAELFNSQNLKDISKEVSSSNSQGIVGAINTVIGLMQVIGTGVSLIMVSLLGIKYLLASVEEKAEIKKTAIPIVIGAVLLFGAVNIIAIIEKFSQKVINE